MDEFKEYEVKSSLLGDDYIDTKDGPAYIRHSLLGGDYLEMPPKKENNPPASSAASRSSATFDPPKFSSKTSRDRSGSDPTGFAENYSSGYKPSYRSSSESYEKRKLIPISSVIIAAVLSLVCCLFLSLKIDDVFSFAIFINFIILFIPKYPKHDDLLYSFFTATVLMGTVGMFIMIAELEFGFLANVIAAAIYFIICKVILSRKIDG